MRVILIVLMALSLNAQTIGNGSFSFLGPLGVNQNITFNKVAEATTKLTATGGSAGNVNGTWQYCTTFVTVGGETALSPVGIASSNSCDPVAVTVTNQQVLLTNIPVSTDNRVIGRNVYRATGPTNFYYRLTAGTTISDNTTTSYTDNVATPVSVGPVWGVENTTSGLFYWGATPYGFIGKGTTAFGTQAALNLAKSTLSTVGNFTVAVGCLGVWSATATSQYNTCVGGGALGTYDGTHDNPDGQNTAVGVVACGGFSTGKFNTCIGGHTIRTGGATFISNRNTAIGATSLLNLGNSANQGDNTALGFAAGTNLSNTTFNLFVGAYAGAGVAGGYAGTNPCANAANDVLTVSQVTFVGPCTGLGGATQVVDSFALGYAATVSASHRGVFGDGSLTDIYAGSETPVATLHLGAIQGNATAPAVNNGSCSGATIGTGANNIAGTITGLPTGTCTVVLTFANSLASAHGWGCHVSDQTTANLFRQSASTTTTVTFTGTSVSGDVLSYGPCAGY